MALGIGLERGQAQNGEIGNVVGEFGAIGPNEKRADKQRMPSELREHAGLDPIFRIGAAIKILGVDLPALGVIKKIVVEQIELLRRQLAVLGPPDRLLRLLVTNDELVLG